MVSSFVQFGKNKFGLRLWRMAVIQAEIKKETSANEILTAEISPDNLARMLEWFVRLRKLYLETINKTQPKSTHNMIRKTAT